MVMLSCFQLKERKKKERKCHRQNVISAVVVKCHLYNFRRVVNEVVEWQHGLHHRVRNTVNMSGWMTRVSPPFVIQFLHQTTQRIHTPNPNRVSSRHSAMKCNKTWRPRMKVKWVSIIIDRSRMYWGQTNVDGVGNKLHSESCSHEVRCGHSATRGTCSMFDVVTVWIEGFCAAWGTDYTVNKSKAQRIPYERPGWV